jgi:CPA2 family monovalent cation:H+ antiporter-2
MILRLRGNDPALDMTFSDISWSFIELGAAIFGMAVLARLAHRISLPAVPLYLLAGLAFGKGGLLPLHFTEDFVHLGAEIGVILLLFMLGLEYTGAELRANLQSGFMNGVADLVLNFVPGFAVGLLAGWDPLSCWLLGGITYISSSGLIARLLEDMKWKDKPETSVVVSILVLEDLAMAVFLPVTGVLLAGGDTLTATLSVAAALAVIGAVLFLALRYGSVISRLVYHGSDEVALLSVLGIVLLVAGIAQQFHISAAVGAFLVGIALSGPIAGKAHRLLGPLRDLFAAIFFLFFGLEIDPASLPPVLPAALGMALITTLGKMATGWWSARRAGLHWQAAVRSGVLLIAHGEFSIVIAGLAVAAGLGSHLGTFSAAYVLVLALLGPLLARVLEPLYMRLQRGAVSD